MNNESLVLTQLSEFPPDTLLDQKALSDALGVSPRTLRRMVSRFEIPPGMTLGGRKIWISAKVLDYLSERAQELARDAERKSAKLRRLL